VAENRPAGVINGDGNPIERPRVKRMTALAALVMPAASSATTAAPADAAVSSASIVNTTATLNLDGANDNETVSVSGGLLVHSGVGGGLESTSDRDSTTTFNPRNAKEHR
jgi:hypothetical protein